MQSIGLTIKERSGEKGEQGDKGEAFKYSDFTPEQLEGLRGPQGEQGETGASVSVIQATTEEEAITLSQQNPNNIYYWQEEI